MNWLGWLSTAVVLTSIEQVLNRMLLSRNAGSSTSADNSTGTSSNNYLIGYNLGALATTLLLFHPSFERLSQLSLALLVISGVLWFLAAYFSFKADSQVEASTTVLIGQTQLVLLFIGGLLIFSESVTLLKTGGATLILGGLTFGLLKRSATTSQAQSTRAHRLGVMSKFAAVIASSAALLIDKSLTGAVDVAIIPVFGYLVPSFLTVALRPTRMIEDLNYSKSIRFSNCFMGAIGAISYFSLIKSFSSGEISAVYPLFQLHILLTLFLANVFLKEKGEFRTRWLTATSIILGAICLSV